MADKPKIIRPIRASRMIYEGKVVRKSEEFGIPHEEARKARLEIMRHPCECGGLDNVLISADIDLKTMKPIAWELAFTDNALYADDNYIPPRLWTPIKFCPFCGKELPVYEAQ